MRKYVKIFRLKLIFTEHVNSEILNLSSHTLLSTTSYFSSFGWLLDQRVNPRYFLGITERNQPNINDEHEVEKKIQCLKTVLTSTVTDILQSSE